MIFFQVSNHILRHSKLQPPPASADKKDDKNKATGYNPERLELWRSTNYFFKNTAIDFAHRHISFDLYDFSVGVKKGYKNIKTFSDLCAYSNGNLYYYPDFEAI